MSKPPGQLLTPSEHPADGRVVDAEPRPLYPQPRLRGLRLAMDPRRVAGVNLDEHSSSRSTIQAPSGGSSRRTGSEVAIRHGLAERRGNLLPSPKGGESLPKAATRASDLDDRPEPPEDHALAVERHLGHVPLHPLVSHHLPVDLIARFPRLVDDPREDDDLVVFGVDGPRERRELAVGNVVGDALGHAERAVLAPHFPSLAGDVLVLVESVLLHRDKESVDVGHGALLCSGTLLHDIGKIGVPDAILRKSGALTDDEWEVMRRHPLTSEELIGNVPGLGHLAPALRAGHERWDGKGYPDGLAGEGIPVASRIAFVCDAYDAMRSDRPYRRALSEEEARAELGRKSGAHFMPRECSRAARGPGHRR